MPNVLPFSQTIRNVKRYAEILRVLAQHGFQDIVQELKLDRLLAHGMTFVGARRVPEPAHIPRPVRLRKAMEQLGPTFIKLGQVLSTRPDLVPQEWADEFRLLQDACPQLDFQVIRRRLEEEFPGRLDELFQSIDPQPIAAASMAQAHRAVLKDGDHIVLKVMRPGIRETTEADMEILQALAQFAERHLSNLGYSPTEVVSEFARELRKEVDLTHEGKATDRFRSLFQDNPAVVFPKVYWEATTTNVLALEEIHGIPLSRLQDGQLTVQERRQLVANGAHAVLRQCLDFGFFHADPHPGNLFALPGGRICFIDCGMTGQLDARTAQQLADLVSGVVLGDLDRVIDVVGALADIDPEKLEDRVFRADVHDLVSHFHDTPLGRLNIGALLREFFQKLRSHRLRCPGDLVLLIKALTTMESVGQQLDPSFDLLSVAGPYVEELVRRRYGLSAIKNRLRNTLLKYAELAEDLPAEIRPLLRQLRRGRLALNLEHRGLDRLNQTIDRSSRTSAVSLIAAAMLVGSSILVLADRGAGGWSLSSLGIGGIIAAALMTAWLLLPGRKRPKDR